MPNEKAQLSDFHRSLKLGRKWQKRRQAAIDGGLRGCVPLFAGDVLLMCGSFQECMLHRTLRFRPSGGRVLISITRAFDCRRCDGKVPGHFRGRIDMVA